MKMAIWSLIHTSQKEMEKKAEVHETYFSEWVSIFVNKQKRIQNLLIREF